MVFNRVTGFLQEPEEHARAPDYWLVRAESGCFFVTRETALDLMARLRRAWKPRWVRFRDLSGSVIELRARSIVMIGESTAEQRAFDRRLLRTLDAEAEEDTRPW